MPSSASVAYWQRIANEEEQWHADNMARRRREAADRYRNDPRYIVSPNPQLYYADPIQYEAVHVLGTTDPAGYIPATTSYRTLTPEGRIGDEWIYLNPGYRAEDHMPYLTSNNTNGTTASSITVDDFSRFTAGFQRYENILTQTSQTFVQANTTFQNFATEIQGNWRVNDWQWQFFNNPIPNKYAEAPRKKAKRLLYSMLTDYQKRMYRKHRYFHVISQTGKKYRLKHGDTMNVYLIEGDKPVKKYCIHPTNVPVEDTLLAQKLLLETDEKAFLKIANKGEVYQHELAA